MEYEREESMGYITGEQAALQLFQKGMTAAFSIGFDGLMDGVVGSFKGFGILAEGLENLGKSIIKNNFNSWVNAFELDGKGGWDWNGEAYQESAWGSGALGMYASAFVTPMAQRGATDFFTQDGTGLDLTGNVFGIKNLAALGNTIGGLTGEFASYLFDGEFSVNVLNLSDLTGGALNHGLIEFSLTGQNRFGGGGANVGGFTGILNSLKAIRSDAIYVASHKLGGNQGLAEINATNRLGYSGMEFNIDLARSIVSGETKVAFENLNGAEGAFDLNRPNTLLLDKSYLGNGAESASKAASILSHEGGHAAYLSDRESGLLGFQTYSRLVMDNLATDAGFLFDHAMQVFLNGQNENGVDEMRITKEEVLGNFGDGVLEFGLYNFSTMPAGIDHVDTGDELQAALFELVVSTAISSYGATPDGSMFAGSLKDMLKLKNAKEVVGLLEMSLDFVNSAKSIYKEDWISLFLTAAPHINTVAADSGLYTAIKNWAKPDITIEDQAKLIVDGLMGNSKDDIVKSLMDNGMPGVSRQSLLDNPSMETAMKYLEMESWSKQISQTQAMRDLDFLNGDGLPALTETEFMNVFDDFIKNKYGSYYKPILDSNGIRLEFETPAGIANPLDLARMDVTPDYLALREVYFTGDGVVDSIDELINGLEVSKLIPDLNKSLRIMSKASNEFFTQSAVLNNIAMSGGKSALNIFLKTVNDQRQDLEILDHLYRTEYSKHLMNSLATMDKSERINFVKDVDMEFHSLFANLHMSQNVSQREEFYLYLIENGDSEIANLYSHEINDEFIRVKKWQNMYRENSTYPDQDFTYPNLPYDLSETKIRRVFYTVQHWDSNALIKSAEAYRNYLVDKGELKYAFITIN
jgi:hypothetical protein